MLIATDPLSLMFIGCFLFGFLFLLVSALLGNLGQGHAGIQGGAHHVGLHVGGQDHGVHAVGHGAQGAHGAHGVQGQQIQGQVFSLFSFINPTSIVLFLLGFGFFGYVFLNTAHLLLPLALILAVVGGLVVVGLILMLLSRIFGDSEGATIQDVSDRTGLLGKVSMTIPEGGLGEILYVSPGGMRKSIAARSVNGQRLERGEEVVVINYQGGVAEVETWEHFIHEDEDIQVDVLASHEDELAKLRALLEDSDIGNTELVIRKDVQKE
jgi:hypothetical protein